MLQQEVDTPSIAWPRSIECPTRQLFPDCRGGLSAVASPHGQHEARNRIPLSSDAMAKGNPALRFDDRLAERAMF